MQRLSEEEEGRILNSQPKGTLALLVAFALIFMAGWLFLYFVRFLGHGTVN